MYGSLFLRKKSDQALKHILRRRGGRSLEQERILTRKRYSSEFNLNSKIKTLIRIPNKTNGPTKRTSAVEFSGLTEEQ